VVLLIGDVALAHDLTGLLAARRLQLSVTIVLLNNGGGAIFDFLALAQAPLARAAGIYEEHIATAPGLDFAAAAALYGLAYERVEDVRGLRAALSRALAAKRSSVLEVPGERAANLALHERIWSAAARELSLPAAEAAPPA
jgi:2-succinyl-5-enolpyruvyl-6-hydroxy-3-cyclohexene-1-carboxylate synthase